MWNYYLAKRQNWRTGHTQTEEHPAGLLKESHCFDLGSDGSIVIACRFHSTASQDQFEGDADVIPFPHVHSLNPIGATIAALLADFGLLATDTTREAAMKLRKHFPIMDPRYQEFQR